MISVGIVFFNEKTENLNLFFSHFTKALAKGYVENCEVKEIIFVLNSNDKYKEQYLLNVLYEIKTSNDYLSLIHI